MVVAISKDGIKRKLVYQESILLVDRDDGLQFLIDNEDLKFQIVFSFSKEGDKYSTTYFDDIGVNLLHYRLNNWDSTTWVEISKPILLKVDGAEKKFWMKFRNNSQENKDFRKFDLSIWKEI